jgi:hypothetical protein
MGKNPKRKGGGGNSHDRAVRRSAAVSLRQDSIISAVDRNVTRAPDTPDQKVPITDAPQNTTRTLLIALTGSNIFALCVGGIYEYLSLRGVISVSAAWVVLLFVWLLGIVGIVISEWVWGKGIKHRIWSGIGTAFVLGLLLFGFDRAVTMGARPNPTGQAISSPTNHFSLGTLIQECPAGAEIIDLNNIVATGNGGCGIRINAGNFCLKSRGNLYLLNNKKDGFCVDAAQEKPKGPQ